MTIEDHDSDQMPTWAYRLCLVFAGLMTLATVGALAWGVM